MSTKPRNRNRPRQGALPTQSAKVALYLRVSSEVQANDGYGIEAQRTALLARCDREGWTDIAEYKDAGISGKSTDRPEFQRMMDDALAGAVTVVMAAKLDRLARNTVDFLQTADALAGAGCRLVMLDPDLDFGTDTGRIMATMFAAFAEWERKLITQRMMGGKGEQASAGGFNGSPIPYGYRYDETIVKSDWYIVEEEADVVRRIFAEFNAGRTLADIARGLNADGITTRNGARWQHPQIKHIVRNGVYAGLRQWNGTSSAPDNGLPAIVTREVYSLAEGRQTRRGRPSN
jgi:site-specific DNA recombinase